MPQLRRRRPFLSPAPQQFSMRMLPSLMPERTTASCRLAWTRAPRRRTTREPAGVLTARTTQIQQCTNGHKLPWPGAAVRFGGGQCKYGSIPAARGRASARGRPSASRGSIRLSTRHVTPGYAARCSATPTYARCGPISGHARLGSSQRASRTRRRPPAILAAPIEPNRIESN